MRSLLDEILSNEAAFSGHRPSCGCPSCSANSGEHELQYDIILKDTRILTTKTKEAPFRYICSFDRNGESWGTGTLIGPSTILTAAHVIWDTDSDEAWDLTEQTIYAIPGRNGDSQPFGSAKVIKIIPAVGYNNSRAVTSSDYAIVQLDKPLGNTVGFWNYSHRKTKVDPIGTSILQGALPLPAGTLDVNLSGYPKDKSGKHQYRSFNKTAKRADGMLYYLNDSYSGHSGSPVWVKRHSSMGGRVLVAIHVGQGGATTKNPNLAVALNDTIRKFIQDNTI